MGPESEAFQTSYFVYRRVILLVGILSAINLILWCVTLPYVVVKIGSLESVDHNLQATMQANQMAQKQEEATYQKQIQMASTEQNGLLSLYQEKLQLQIQKSKLELTQQNHQLSDYVQRLEKSGVDNSKDILSLQETIHVYNQFWRSVTDQVLQYEQKELQANSSRADLNEPNEDDYGSGDFSGIDYTSYTYGEELGSGEELKTNETLNENPLDRKFGVPEYVLLRLACRQGEPGQKGEPGRRGFHGLAGAPGIPGLAGAPGYPGSKGEKGDAGVKGDTGVNGIPGISGTPGYPGSKGEKGDVGLTGNIGPNGVKGEQGPTGLHGQTGPKGKPGERGVIGMPGAPGEPGMPGTKGQPGITGPPGINGVPGEPGQDGVDGAVGAKGEPGNPGSKGEKGDIGMKGEVGHSGPKGNKGESGEKGLIGPPGQDGRDGADVAIPNLMTENNLERILNSTMSATIEAIKRGGLKGDPGRNGEDGIPGKNGHDGTPGTNGTPGSNGTPGINGIPGEKGEPGLTAEEVLERIKVFHGVIDDDMLDKLQTTLHRVSSQKTWAEAQEFCVNNGKWLAIVNSQAVIDKISRKYSLPYNIWIGGKRSETDSKFYWTLPTGRLYTGPPVGRQLWNQGEPNDSGGNEDCIEMRGTTKKFNDVPCATKFGAFLCQKFT